MKQTIKIENVERTSDESVCIVEFGNGARQSFNVNVAKYIGIEVPLPRPDDTITIPSEVSDSIVDWFSESTTSDDRLQVVAALVDAIKAARGEA